MDDATARAAKFWDNAPRVANRARWWQSPTVVRHINRRVCGQPVDGVHAGFHRRLAEFASPICKAVSVGCGNGAKEIGLVLSGQVKEFHLFEISAERVKAGKARAADLGVSGRVHFHLADAFEACRATDFDLVYWNNALHHMMDVRAAVEWSRDRLKDDGVFAMDDFVGPSRFQWSDRSLEFASKFRSSLTAGRLISPSDPSKSLVAAIKRPTIEDMIKADPSEAADSDNIIPALRFVFPDVTIQFTGGAIYHLGLNDVLANFKEDEEGLGIALLLDDALSEMGENQYAIALARRRSKASP